MDWYTARIVTHSYLQWFLLIASSVRKLTVVVMEGDPGLLSHMLTLAGTAAPNLHTLTLCGVDECVTLGRPEIQSLIFLGQLKRLELGKWRFPDDGVVLEIELLAGLHSLEVHLYGPRENRNVPPSRAKSIFFPAADLVREAH
jgi:hypothetical protein